MPCKNNLSPQDVVDAFSMDDDISNAHPPVELEDTNFNSLDEVVSNSVDTIILDENVVADLMNGVWRENYEEPFGLESFPVLEILDKTDRELVYVDKGIIKDEDSAKYGNKSLVNKDAMSLVTDFVDYNCSDLAVDEWSAYLDEEEDDLYRLVSLYQDSILLTYDGDFSSFERAMTPETYLSYDDEGVNKQEFEALET